MSQTWTPKPGDRVVRHPRARQLDPVRIRIPTRRIQPSVLASPLILTYGFAALISLGTLLLLLPFAHHGSGFTSFVDALFTATSAATVTGLVTQDTATYWNAFGKATILLLMFTGGLGFMTIATFLLVVIGQRAPVAQRHLARNTLQLDQLGGMASLTARIVLVSSGIQLVGLVALAVRFSFMYSPGEAIWQAAFHAVSAFNSAGFVIAPESSSFSVFRTDRVVLTIMGALIVMGAVGYWVLADIVRSPKPSLFTLNTKLVIIATLALITLGALVFFVSERHNTETLGPISSINQIFVSVFESISGRTAGFSTVGFGETKQHTNFFFTSLMFIGGASASVAGGIKINTLAVVIVAVISTIRGVGHSSAFGREIPQAQVQRAVSVMSVALAAVFLSALILILSEGDFLFIDLLFESVSAFSTVGLSTGLTPDLSDWGHVILIASMFIGRIGPTTLGLVMIMRTSGDVYRFAQERVTIG